MANTEQIISPGVFTRENDLSFLPQGVGAIGAAVVGPTEKGPAFVPTVVRSFSEFQRRFGTVDNDTYVPQTVREYLRNAGSVTVCRVLGGSGYEFASGTTEPCAVIAGSEGTAVAAAFATGSMRLPNGFGFNVGTAAVSSSIHELQITIGTTTHRFVEADPTSVPVDAGDANTYFFATGSNEGTALTNLVAEINAASIGVSATSQSNEQNAGPGAGLDKDGATFVGGLQLTASSAGTDGNAITVKIGPAGGAMSTTFTDGQEFGAGGTMGGGVDPDLGRGILIGLIYPSKIADQGTPSLQNSVLVPAANHRISSSFKITLAGTGVTSFSTSASLNPINRDYLFSIIGDSPNNSKTSATTYAGTPGWTFLNFKNLQTSILGTNSLTGYGAAINSGSVVALAKSHASNKATFNELSKNEGYSYASTPFIQSQIAKGRKDLFKFHTLDHGNGLSQEYKISIANLKEPADIDNVEQYSQFSVILRKCKDTDKSPVIIEQFNNCTLDPDSTNYISRVIGDRYPEYNETLGKVELKGNYPNISNHIRVEVHDTVTDKGLSPKISPKGFKAVINTFPTASLNVNCVFPSASYEGVQQVGTDGTYNSRGYLGFKGIEKAADNINFLHTLPTTQDSNISGDFNVEDYSGHSDSSLWSGSLSASISVTGATGPTSGQIKFTVPFQGGSDGIAPWRVKNMGAEITATNLYGFNMDGTDKAGYKAYKKALDILSNQDEYDINMLAMPGVIYSLHSATANAGIDLCEERGDAFFVMDLNISEASVNTAVNNVSGLDSNYAAVYYPWVKILNSRSKPVLVPPSVIVPGAIAASDRIAAEWFAPAGLNRGVLGNVLEAKIRLNQSERDVLYDNKINPIATFPQTGVCIWGQKTLQERSTALDRINVRRLLIALKKFIASSSKYLVFEQNTQATRNRFLNIVNPYLESVQQRQGLFAFRVQMDEGNNTPTVIDRNQLVGAIYLQPTKTAEFIVLDFNVLPTGATFDGGGSAGGTGGGGGY